MRTFLRCLAEHRPLWRVWLGLLPLVAVSPLLALALPMLERSLIDEVVLAGRPDLLAGVVGLYAGAWGAALVVGVLSVTLLNYLSEAIAMRYRQHLFAHAARLSVDLSNRDHSGRTMSLFANDVPNVSGLIGTVAAQAIGSTIGVTVATVLMIAMSWQLALATAVAPPIVGGLAILLTRPLRPAARRVQDKASELVARVQENLGGMREVVAFGREDAQARDFMQTLRELLRLRMRVVVMESALQSGRGIFSLAITLVVLGYGGYLVVTGATTLGTVLAMRLMFAQTMTPIVQLLGLIAESQKALGAADRIYEFLNQVPRVRERPTARAPQGVQGEVTFRDVAFAYGADRPVLHEISFTAQPGERIALVGPSGAGKSTLVSLVARFYDPTAGSILLDGVDIRDLTLAGLRDQIAIVFQSTFLFDASIRENIAFGRAGSTETEVIRAANAANAWEFIQRLPRGLSTRVGERGAQLSEGQRQRVAIARALLRDPRVLILDEPTSALDARSELLLQSALRNLIEHRTSFVIAHRLATVVRADRIVVLDNGRVVQQGTHPELMARPGLYRELFRIQFGGASAYDGKLPLAALPAGTS